MKCQHKLLLAKMFPGHYFKYITDWNLLKFQVTGVSVSKPGQIGMLEGGIQFGFQL